MSDQEACHALARCCGASRWVDTMMSARPFGSQSALLDAAHRAWSTMERSDILEAFTHHPKIGANLDALRARFGATADLSSNEQARVAHADEETLRALHEANLAYEARFGYIFIVCASGKTADEMLAILRSRMDHEEAEELAIAAAEQMKITVLRLTALETEDR